MYKKEYIVYCTGSVLNFLKENESLVNRYLLDVYSRGGSPNYSEMLIGVISGETRDGISFDSIYVDRKVVTAYLRRSYVSLYEEWGTLSSNKQ